MCDFFCLFDFQVVDLSGIADAMHERLQRILKVEPSAKTNRNEDTANMTLHLWPVNDDDADMITCMDIDDYGYDDNSDFDVFMEIDQTIADYDDNVISDKHRNIFDQYDSYSVTVKSIEKKLREIERIKGSNAAKQLEVKILNLVMQWE